MKKVNYDPIVKSEFEKEEDKIKFEVKEEMKRRKILGLPPDDDEAQKFIKDRKDRINKQKEELIQEYKKRNT